MATKTISKKPKENYFWRVLGLFSELKWRIVAIIVVGIIGISIFILIPGYLKDVFASLGNTQGLDPIISEVLYLLAMYVGLTVLTELFAGFCIVMILRYENKASIEILNRVKKKLDVVPTSFLEGYTVGDLIRRVAHNAAEVVKGCLTTIYGLARAIFFYVLASILMFNIDGVGILPWFGAGVLPWIVIASLPICILAAKFVSNKTQKFYSGYTAKSAVLSSYVNQKISLHNFFKMNGLVDTEEFKAKSEESTRAQVGEDTAIAINTVYITFISNFMNVLITVVCGIFIVQGNLAFAALPLFLEQGRRFLKQNDIVINATNLLQMMNGRGGRVFAILDCPDDVTEKEHITIKQIQGQIEFKNVTLVQGNDRLLDNVSFKIPQGKSVAIVGPTGCGKRTLVELISKLKMPTEGTITVDGIKLDEIIRNSYYDRMCIAFEKPFIFVGTVADNILYGISRTLPEHVMDITKKLGSHDFIEQLPQGYETDLWENTTLLTTSQKQAINVARAALEAPDLLILSEAMSAADIKTEKKMVETLIKLNPRQTKIFVTNRIATIQSCDIIMFMDKGRIIEMGSHDQLVKKGKRYYKAITVS